MDWSKQSGSHIAAWMADSSRVAVGAADPVEIMWEDRKLSLLGFVCPMLCALRDAGYLKLDLPLAFKALELDSIMRLSRLGWVGDDEIQMAKRYLGSLQGFVEGADSDGQPAAAREQHDFMRFAIELPLRKAMGLGFGDSKPIPWERIPDSRDEMMAIAEAKVLALSLDRASKKSRRRL